MKHTPPYTLIAKYLAKQTTPGEVAELLAWRHASPENEHLFEELSAEWELATLNPANNNIIPDKEKIWRRIQQQTQPLRISYSKSFVVRVASIAATIALIIGLSVSFLFNKEIAETPTLTSTFIAPEGQKSQLILADGTRVWLNSGTTLTYTNKFGQNDRHVSLNGEAFFDVVKDKHLKFIVSTGKVDVVVHGTSFNVKSYPKDADVAVSLITGKVDVISSENNKSITMLKPGQKAIIVKSGLKFTKANCDTSLEGIWRLKRLKFEGATITEVAKKLSAWYGIKIEVTEVNRFQKYWFTVKEESLADILKSMNNLHPIKYNISNEKVVISSK